MVDSFIERQMKNVAQELFDDKTLRILDSVGKIAAKQGGDNIVENYQLLGMRAIVGLVAAVVAVEAVTSLVGFVVARRSEEQRVERIVRRVLEEERQKEAAQTASK